MCLGGDFRPAAYPMNQFVSLPLFTNASIHSQQILCVQFCGKSDVQMRSANNSLSANLKVKSIVLSETITNDLQYELFEMHWIDSIISFYETDS